MKFTTTTALLAAVLSSSAVAQDMTGVPTVNPSLLPEASSAVYALLSAASITYTGTYTAFYGEIISDAAIALATPSAVSGLLATVSEIAANPALAASLRSEFLQAFPESAAPSGMGASGAMPTTTTAGSAAMTMATSATASTGSSASGSPTASHSAAQGAAAPTGVIANGVVAAAGLAAAALLL